MRATTAADSHPNSIHSAPSAARTSNTFSARLELLRSFPPPPIYPVVQPFAMLPVTSRLAFAAPRPILGLGPLVRPLHTTQHRLFAQPPPPPPQHELNEAEQYLANKAARKAERARNPTGASARHASLYSQLFPALLRILAYGSTAYFGLHLLWNVLDRDEQTKLMDRHAGSLESTARSLAEKVDHATQKFAPSTTAAESEQSQPRKRWYWPF